MRVLLTGGAGFIGSALARRLTGDGHDVCGLDDLRPQVHDDPDRSRREFPGDLVIGDVCDASTWSRVPDDIDVIVHLAAETGVGQSMYETDSYERTNVDGTGLAATEARRRGVPLLSMSSRAVYGEGRYECPTHGRRFGGPCCPAAVPAPSAEDDPHLPVSVYGHTKSRAELVVDEIAASHVPVTVVRPQNVVGPGQSLHNPYTGVLAAFLSRLRAGRSLQVFGDGRASRDFVHVDDVVTMLTWALMSPPGVGAPRVLNCGTGRRTTLLQLAHHALDARGLDHSHVEFVTVHRAGDIVHACADRTRADAAGAPAPVHDTADAVHDFVDWGWERPAVPVQVWDRAIDELASRGLLS